jgi:hypothetical protein
MSVRDEEVWFDEKDSTSTRETVEHNISITTTTSNTSDDTSIESRYFNYPLPM